MPASYQTVKLQIHRCQIVDIGVCFEDGLKVRALGTGRIKRQKKLIKLVARILKTSDN